MSKKDGGAAFPTTTNTLHPGMSLRDHFAATADITNQLKDFSAREAEELHVPMPTLDNELEWATWHARIKARLRFIEADAMLAERERTGGAT